MFQGDVLNLKIRNEIYSYILNHPGMHLSRLSRDMKISKTTLNYHKNQLVKTNLITISKSKGYQRFYVLQNSAIKYKKILDILRHKTPRHILLLTLIHTVSSRKEMIGELNLHPNTVDKTLTKLLKMDILEVAPVNRGVIQRTDGGIVKRNPEGREVFYRITKSTIEDIYEAFIIYQKTIFEEDSIGAIVDTFDRANILPNEIPRRDKSFDRVYDKLEEIFPHPYHA
ncbi:MAG: hypothetical protein JSW62_03110 [Thermoplasmatales archaeon]|nr:MAG: hypothetical protein JSW62_03110 [Thermoplasmatales archaeon]